MIEAGVAKPCFDVATTLQKDGVETHWLLVPF